MSQQEHEREFMARAAEHYERYFVPSIGAPVAAHLVEAASLHPGERILDAACGTGVVTKLAAAKVAPGGGVAGVDPNPARGAAARATTPAGVPIAWHEAPAERVPFADGTFDAVLCGMGLQFFGDRAAGLREFHRVLVPGGRLAANVPGPAPPPLAIMADALARHIGPEGAAFVHAVFALHDPDELRHLATQAGFEHRDVRSADVALSLPPPAEFLWQYVGSTPLAAIVAKASDGGRRALEEDFSRNCQALAATRPVTGTVRITTLLAKKQGASAHRHA